MKSKSTSATHSYIHSNMGSMIAQMWHAYSK